ncbi:hypothetical protein AQ505_02090 [Pedobacter sp. PACM 27299]|uniref:serine O-acetyltransferase n=1 Tax=Pedobacter sp. PACM 27299 TaxID=1727164 RepID=UPI0007062DF8|nr:hypothetical protein [Pedobacter sp. PACM 27299]ALL04394.1 hypothetical protein AQ505_02090 [Pedobacter sp. PACM 27299]
MTCFCTYILEYIKKDFDLNQIKASKDALILISNTLTEVFPVFMTDVKSKYPGMDEKIDDDSLIKLVQSDCTLIACLLYRVERRLFLEDSSSPILSNLANLMRTRTGIELYYSTEIGPGLNIQHGSGIVVGPRYFIGKNFMIHQGVTLGQRKAPTETIIIGDNVKIFAGAKVLGNITIGDNVKIAANAVLLTDALSDSTYIGIPAKRLEITQL